jgi:hypothetical protein
MLTTTEKIPALLKLDRSVKLLRSSLDADKDRLPCQFWVAGGAVLAAIAGERINDYDIFSPHPQRLIAILDATPAYKKGKSDDGFFQNYTDQFGNTIQIITRVSVASPSVIFEIFDYTIVCAAWDGQTFYCHDRFWQDVSTRRLVVNALPYPLKSMERMAKYASRGYKPCPIGLLALARAINSLQIDWNNPKDNEISFYPDGTPRFAGVD